MYDVGVDLAWGMRSPGLAALDHEGHLLAVTQLHTDDEILNWLQPWVGEACLVAIDAPIVVRNATGSRPCEQLVGRYFGRFHASCHSANTSNPAFAGGTRAQRLAEALGLDADPNSTQLRRAVEVYPHPAIVVLFNLVSVLQYKDKSGRNLQHMRTETLRLLDYLDGLAKHAVALHPRACPQWPAIRAAVQTAATKAELRRVEDSIDAVVCAYIARYARMRPDSVRILGTSQDGHILVPVNQQIAALMDSDEASGHERRLRRRPHVASGKVETDVGGSASAADPCLVGLPFLVLDVAGRPSSYSSTHEWPWKAAIRQAVSDRDLPVRDTRFGVVVAFRTPVAANANEVWDLDNLVKPTLDAMEGVFGPRLWAGHPQAADDRVDYLQASKRTVAAGETTGAHIEVFDLRL